MRLWLAEEGHVLATPATPMLLMVATATLSTPAPAPDTEVTGLLLFRFELPTLLLNYQRIKVHPASMQSLSSLGLHIAAL